MKLPGGALSSKRNTTLGRSGVFSLDENLANDGVVGRTEFVALWQGVAELDSITDSAPTPSLLAPHWFVFSLPFHWN